MEIVIHDIGKTNTQHIEKYMDFIFVANMIDRFEF